ncbi:soluble guanylate cyclase gcy-31-like [Saccoglossus kowalevskii]
MYGLIIESICEYLRDRYGEEKWMMIRERAGLQKFTFATHQIYSEKFIPRITNAANGVCCVEKKDLMLSFGVSFVGFVGKYGYDRVLRVLGRHMRDFLNGLDNLHEYLRFSYPMIKPPSFFVTEETANGLTLIYRSKRKGFLHYSIGQLKQVGRKFYNLDIQVEVVSEDVKSDNTFGAVFRLYFDNKEFKSDLGSTLRTRENWHIKSDDFFELFPFCVVFDQDLIIRHAGPKLSTVLPGIVDYKMDDIFSLTRPLVSFTWDDFIVHTNNVFELASKQRVQSDSKMYRYTSASHQGRTGSTPRKEGARSSSLTTRDTRPNYDVNSELLAFEAIAEKTITKPDTDSDMDETNMRPRRLFLRGQMKYMTHWNCMIYLATPLMPNLDAMFRTTIFVNDLAMHDSSRDLVLAGTQQSVELKLALDQEQRKSAKLEESMKKLDIEMKRTDSLLYQMIPRQVAERLRRGEPALSTCEVFKDVTILFSDVVGFTHICSMITPMAVVSMLNAMYSKFDKLTEQHQVYKVETIGDAYMVVSGAPTKTKYHAEHIADMSLGMVQCMQELRDPSSSDTMKVRIGIHSGMVVAGVVGLKMPRYCLFGDTVNCASRMETSGDTMKIHMSQTTKDYLAHAPYITTLRGSLEIKGKGEMKTYWLLGKRRKSGSVGNKDATTDTPEQTTRNAASVMELGASEDDEEVNRSRRNSEEYQHGFPMSAVPKQIDSDSQCMDGVFSDRIKTILDGKDFRERSSSANSHTLPKTALGNKNNPHRRSSASSFLSAEYTPVNFTDVEGADDKGLTMTELEQEAELERERLKEFERHNINMDYKRSVHPIASMGTSSGQQTKNRQSDDMSDTEQEDVQLNNVPDGDDADSRTSLEQRSVEERETKQYNRSDSQYRIKSPPLQSNRIVDDSQEDAERNGNIRNSQNIIELQNSKRLLNDYKAESECNEKDRINKTNIPKSATCIIL